MAALQANMLPLAAKPQNVMPQQQQQKAAPVHDPMGNLKRTRSGNAMDKAGALDKEQSTDKNSGRRKSLSAEDRWPELPDHSAFDEALVAAILAPVLGDEPTATEAGNGKQPASCGTSPAAKEKMGKRLRIFQDITQTVNTF
uniref:Uncharacterized protein n=1 Tax=Arundo donax TaxID=35708 RepID=A0A0A9ATE3_ARUDO